MNNKLKNIYILFLLIIVSLLIYIAQNISEEGMANSKEIEFSRIDDYNEQLGNITQISVNIYNNDTINHKYTVTSSVDSVFYSNETVEVSTDMPYTYSLMIPIEKKYTEDNKLIDNPIHRIKFTVFRDDLIKPLDLIEFKFD